LTGYDLCVQASPGFANELLYTGGSFDDNVYALDPATGATKWSYPTKGGILSAPAIVGNVVYVTSYDNKSYALNAQTGAFLWSYQTGDLVYSSPAVVNGVEYFGSYDHNLYAVGQVSGSTSSNTGIPTIAYYVILIIFLVVIIAVAVVMFRKRK
jgi:outer membrane protein assembly factor BamB